jgi:hypothetical protein
LSQINKNFVLPIASGISRFFQENRPDASRRVQTRPDAPRHAQTCPNVLPQPVVTTNVQYVQVPLPARRWNTVALWQHNYRSGHDKLKTHGSVARVVLAGIWHKTSGHTVELTTDGSAFEICDSQFSSVRRQKPPQLQKDGRLTYFSHYGRLRVGGQLVEEIQWSNGTVWRRQ